MWTSHRDIDCGQHPALKKLVQDAIAAMPGVGRVAVSLSTKIVSHAVQRGVIQQIVHDRNIEIERACLEHHAKQSQRTAWFTRHAMAEPIMAAQVWNENTWVMRCGETRSESSA